MKKNIVILLFLLLLLLLINPFSKYNVSICIPMIIRDENNILHLIESINQQTVKPFEVIIGLCGVSTEKMEELKKKYKKACEIPLKMYLTSHELKYAGYNRNFTGNKASGDILVFMDADDTFRKNAIEETINIYKKYNTQSLIHNYQRYSQKTTNKHIKNLNINKVIVPCRILKRAEKESRHLFYIKSNLIQKYVKNNNSKITHGHFSITKKLFNKIKYNETMKRGEDAEYIKRILRLPNDNIMIYSSQILTNYYK
jgi:glycosyltransferase involved in cell wall biosynthesis